MRPSKFVCDYCDRTFSRKYNLKNHIENRHLNITNQCDVCHQSFGTSPGYLLHMSRGHNRIGQPFPECDICGRIFTRRQNIISHMYTIHRDRIFTSKRKPLISSSDLKCPSCDKTFTTDCSLRRHIKELHDFDYTNCNTCVICNKVFKRKYGLQAHIQTCHSGKVLLKQCPMCDKAYVSKSHLKRHIELNHNQDAGMFNANDSSSTNNGESVEVDSNSEEDNSVYVKTCKDCNIEFDTEILLRQHIKLDHSFETYYNYCKSALKRYSQENLIYTCEFCPNKFKHASDLKCHLKLKHNREFTLSTCYVCYEKFYTEVAMTEHKKTCLPPANCNKCSHCEKLFSEKSSLELHLRTFHPQSQLADPNITSTYNDESTQFGALLSCKFCDRIYYSDKTLKHHMKLKHTTDEAMDCQFCGKVYNNKYYLASHIKQVHNSDDWLKCDYCEKQFRSKKNIRHHIEYTHLGMQRHKCIECDTLFKEKRNLRKHVRRKHANSSLFPQCHICKKRFESAKSCKIHLKLIHGFNSDTFPCHLCSISFGSNVALELHIKTKHLAENEIYKCEECNAILKGHQAFEQHMELHRVTPSTSRKTLPRCILCAKDFSTRKTLKRHIKKFHTEFDAKELANCGSTNKDYNVDCEECMKNFMDEAFFKVYETVKNDRYARVFKCEFCSSSYTPLEFAIHRYKMKLINDSEKSKTIMSGLCTAEMSDDDPYSEFGKLQEMMEPESTTVDIKEEPADTEYEGMVKREPQSP